MTVQEALTELLSEDRFLLKNSAMLVKELKERVAPGLELTNFCIALSQTNIGESLLVADSLDNEARAKAEEEAVNRLKKINMREGFALQVVQTLAKVLEDTRTGSSQSDSPPPPINYYNEGVTLATGGEFDEAIKLFSRYIESESNDASAYRERGMCYHAVQQDEKALADLNKAIELDPDDESSRSLWKKINVIVNGSHEVEAEPHEEVNPPIEVIKAPRPKDKNDIDSETIVKPTPRPGHIKKMIIAFVAGALVLFIGFVVWGAKASENKKLAQEHNAVGLSYFNGKQYDKALSEYEQAIKLNPKLAEAYNNRGDVYYGQGKYDNALSDYTEAIKLNHKYTEAYYNRGLAYYEKKEYDKALEDFDQAIKLNPDYAMAYYKRGNIFFYNKDETDKGITDFDRVIELNPDYYQAYYDRGVAFLSKDEYDKSFADFSKAIELNSQYGAPYYGRGRIYYERKDYDNAIKDLGQAIKINQQFYDAYFWRGRAYTEKEMYYSASSDLGKAIELNPQYADAYYYRALIYDKNMKRAEDAMKDYSQAISLAPKKYAAAYNNRAEIYYNKGNYDQALADLQEALAITPDNKVIQKNFQIVKKAAGR